MAETDVLVPPGEYAVPGLGRLLVIEGAAKLKAPSGPADLASLIAATADPTPPANPSPAPSGPKPSAWVTILLAIVAALAGAKLPGLLPGGPDPVPIPAPVAPVKPEPKPAPTPPPAPQPAPKPKPDGTDRPDWLPALEKINARLDAIEALASARPAPEPPVPAAEAAPAPVQYAQTAEPAVYYLPAGAPCPPGYCPVR